MTKKQRREMRDEHNGLTFYKASRKPAMPSPKVVPLKHKAAREKAVLRSWNIR